MRAASTYRSARRNLLRGLGAVRDWRAGPFYAWKASKTKRRQTIIHATANGVQK